MGLCSCLLLRCHLMPCDGFLTENKDLEKNAHYSLGDRVAILKASADWLNHLKMNGEVI
jgi:hypothetical protein